MIAGQTPFKGDSAVETLNAILKESAPQLSALGPEATEASAAEMQHIVDKCLAKEPEDRYQGAEDLVVDLRSVRRRLESGQLTAPAIRARVSPWFYVSALAAAVLVMVAVVWMIRQQPTEELAPSTTLPSRPSIAVLYFENASGDSELDWLRDGLTDMLVTDLSQSPNLDVLSMEQLYQILKDMGRLEEPIASLEDLQEFAQTAETQTAIVGSFMKAGENIRINIRVQDAVSGEIQSTEKVEGVGEERIFSMVDELTRRIKTRFDLAHAADGDVDQDLVDVTTSSVDAYRYFVQAKRLEYEGQWDQGVPLFAKAVEIDPEFATAMNALAIAHWYLRQINKYEQYSRKAFELRHRLPARERLYIEGTYYSLKEETFAQSISALQKAVELYPNDLDSRNDLAWSYLRMERLDEAKAQLEVLLQMETPDVASYLNYVECTTSLGQFDVGHDAIRKYLERSPNNAAGYRVLGQHLTWWGKLDEALDALQMAESLGGLQRSIDRRRWEMLVLRKQWEEAEATARRESTSEGGLRGGSQRLALTQLFHGQTEKALEQLNRMNYANKHNYVAHIFLEQGHATQALEQADAAQQEGVGDNPEWRGLHLAAVAQARLGRFAEADATAEKLRLKTQPIPTQKEKRRYLHTLGEIDLARGDTSRAVDSLIKAESMLPPRGGGCCPGSTHVPIWFSLASAHLANGNEEQARRWFQHIIESGIEHVGRPIQYVRSFYFLGKIHENRGEMDKAREYYRRFVDYWGDGDIDRERVEEARIKSRSGSKTSSMIR
jgi:tetratricopeptide (TPR) repeat protein